MFALRPPTFLRAVQSLLCYAVHVPLCASQVFPNDKTSTQRYNVHLTREVWIDAADFREQDAKGYFGLAPNKTVMLRYLTLQKA